MHFVGMVAYHIDSEVSFDLRITMLSLLIAVVVAGIGIWLVAADPFDLIRLVGGGLFAGLGVAAMHYTGMAATQVTSDPGIGRPTGFDPLALGILIAIGSTIILMFVIVAALGGVAEEAWLRRQRTAWEHRLDRLGAVLDDQTKEPGSGEPGSGPTTR